MVTLVDRSAGRVDDITARAREVRFWPAVLAMLSLTFYVVGWVAAKACTSLWLAVTWSAVAVKMGWTDARSGGPRGPAR